MSRDRIEEIFPLTPTQQGLLFHSLAERGVYIEQLSCRFEGGLDAEALRLAWQRALDRHQALRAAFVWEQRDEPLQVVLRKVELPWRSLDWRDAGPQEQERRLAELHQEDLALGFDVAQAPLLRLTLVRLGERRYGFLWSYHHLILDRWSSTLVLQEVMAAYTAFSQGRELPLEPAPTLRGYFAWLKRQDLAAAEAYWRRALAGLRPPEPLLLEAPRSGALAERHTRRLLAAAVADLTAAVRRHQVTPNVLLRAAWALTLSRYSGTEDVVFGATVSGRPPSVPGIESMVGLMINTLPVRIGVRPTASVGPWLWEIQTAQVAAAEHEHSPLVEIQRWSDIRPGTPLFETILVFENTPRGRAGDAAGGGLLPLDVASAQHTHYPLTLVAGIDQSLAIELDYDRRRFSRLAMERLADHVCNLLLALAAAAPETRLWELDPLSAAERQQLLVEWNATEAANGAEGGLMALVSGGLRRFPESRVIYEGRALTFRELDRRASALARQLRRHGVGVDSVVGVFMERSLELLVALVGVLKAGAAYLPLEPDHPADRLAFIVDDARPAVVLVQEGSPHALAVGAAEVIPVGESRSEPEDNDPSPLPDETAQDSAAYVIYTSGSTGRPKGAVNTQRGIANRLLWMQETYRLTPEDRVLQKTPFGFDVSVWEFFWPLISGAHLVVARPGGHRDSAYLIDLIRTQEVTTLHFVPAMLALFLEEPGCGSCRSLRRVLSSGQALPAELQERFHARMRAELHNLYGPTEAAVDVTFWPCTAGAGKPQRESVPIGRPVANTSVYVLDRDGTPVPLGAPGELCLGGVQLARGYLRRPQLTAEKFVPDPFSSAPGARLYRTGDLARHRADGALEFLGRIDDQVKIRGLRIELGEIESILATHPEVVQTAVVPRADGTGDQQLVAYVVSHGSLSAGELRAHLARQLPEPMLPSRFVFLTAMPLLPSGKIDRRALPKPERKAPVPPAAAAGPRNEIEQVVAKLFCEVLGREAIGVHESFFDLGAHSLHLMRVYAKLRAVSPRELQVTDLFRYPNVSALAAYLSGAPDGSPPAAQAAATPAATPGSRDIAIIGISCRLPGAASQEELWECLRQGKEGISFFSVDELAAAGVEAGVLADPRFVPAKGSLAGMDLFDAGFFGFSPREAEITDPQQRLFLECAWEALEDAGHAGPRGGRFIGVYGGAGRSPYWLNVYAHPEIVRGVGEYQVAIGNDKDYLATRVSYKLDLRGPSIGVQTACSTSLVAVHLACQGLLAGECDLALAGGASVDPVEKGGYFYEEGGIASPDGHCRAFSASAGGTVAGSGVGVVVLRRLEDALTAGDPIYAVIKGSAINNDGSAKVGYTAPSVEGQVAVIAAAQAAGGLAPETVSMIEAHGTGTVLGDPIELTALEQVLGGSGGRGFCSVGSVKSNLGHLDAAAGVAGLIKAALSLHHEEIPASLHCETPTPQIDWSSSPLYVARERVAWPRGERVRRAGVELVRHRRHERARGAGRGAGAAGQRSSPGVGGAAGVGPHAAGAGSCIVAPGRSPLGASGRGPGLGGLHAAGGSAWVPLPAGGGGADAGGGAIAAGVGRLGGASGGGGGGASGGVPAAGPGGSGGGDGAGVVRDGARFPLADRRLERASASASGRGSARGSLPAAGAA